MKHCEWASVRKSITEIKTFHHASQVYSFQGKLVSHPSTTVKGERKECIDPGRGAHNCEQEYLR